MEREQIYGVIGGNAIPSTVSTESDSTSTDGGSFTTDTSKGIGSMAVVEPTDTMTAGELGIISMTKFRELIMAGYDAINNANRQRDINPDSSLKVKTIDFIDGTNVVAATYRSIFDLAGAYLDNATINVICAGGITCDLFGTNNDDADDTADTGWVDLGLATIVDTTDGWAITGQEPWDRLMIKYVASDASNSIVVDYTAGA